MYNTSGTANVSISKRFILFLLFIQDAINAPLPQTPPPPPPPPPTPPPRCCIYPSKNWASIGSYNGLPPVQRQAITIINADALSIGYLGTSCIDIWIKLHNFSFMKLHLKMSSAKWQPFCPWRDELMYWCENCHGCSVVTSLAMASNYSRETVCELNWENSIK